MSVGTVIAWKQLKELQYQYGISPNLREQNQKIYIPLWKGKEMPIGFQNRVKKIISRKVYLGYFDAFKSIKVINHKGNKWTNVTAVVSFCVKSMYTKVDVSTVQVFGRSNGGLQLI